MYWHISELQMVLKSVQSNLHDKTIDNIYIKI